MTTKNEKEGEIMFKHLAGPEIYGRYKGKFSTDLSELTRPDLNDEQFDQHMRDKISKRIHQRVYEANQNTNGVGFFVMLNEDGYPTCGGMNCGECVTCYDIEAGVAHRSFGYRPLITPIVIGDHDGDMLGHAIKSGGFRRDEMIITQAFAGRRDFYRPPTSALADLVNKVVKDGSKPLTVSMESSPAPISPWVTVRRMSRYSQGDKASPLNLSTFSGLLKSFSTKDVPSEPPSNYISLGYRRYEPVIAVGGFVVLEGKRRFCDMDDVILEGFVKPTRFYPMGINIFSTSQYQPWVQTAINRFIYMEKYQEAPVWSERLGEYVSWYPDDKLLATIVQKDRKQASDRLNCVDIQPNKKRRGY